LANYISRNIIYIRIIIYYNILELNNYSLLQVMSYKRKNNNSFNSFNSINESYYHFTIRFIFHILQYYIMMHLFTLFPKTLHNTLKKNFSEEKHKICLYVYSHFCFWCSRISYRFYAHIILLLFYLLVNKCDCRIC